MEKKKTPYLSRIEWEDLQEKWEIDELIESESMPTGAKKIEVWRDEAYELKAKITGTRTYTSESSGPNGVPGTPIPSFELEGSSHWERVKYKLSHCVLGNETTKWGGREDSGQDLINFETELLTYYVQRTLRLDSLKTGWLTEWYLNGPSRIFYPHFTHRNLKEEYRRTREFVGEDATFGGAEVGSSGGCAFIQTPDVSFIIQSVPKELGPSWSECLGIEYRDAWGGIPDIANREALSQIVGFVMGRQLVNVGLTRFNDFGYPLEQIAKSPVKDNLVAACQSSGDLPVDISSRDHKNLGRIEPLLQQLVPGYLALQDELNFNQVLFGYWLSEELPLGANLPVLATSVSMLTDAWSKTLSGNQ